MAQDNNDTEQTAAGTEAVEKKTDTVKKKTAKKAARKKVAKKKVASKKAVVKKTDASAASAAPEAGPAPVKAAVAPAPSASHKPGEAAAASVAAASGSAPKQAPAASAEIRIMAKPNKEEATKESAMSTPSKSAGGFWVKVLFWLVIIVLVFMLIRSLAKHPSETGVASSSSTSAETQATAAQSGESAGSAEKAVSVEAGVGGAGDRPAAAKAETSSGKPVEAQEAIPVGSAGEPEAAASESVGELAASAELRSAEPSADTAVSEGAAGESAPTTADVSTEATASTQTSSMEAGADAAAQAAQTPRDLHDESVARILKEFDDLREASRAEMEAMRNLMQQRRELENAMTPPRYPPAWNPPAAGYYNPYAPPAYPRY